ncbi:MAG: hypothetical protein GY866_27285 [Proteobacteria bacterium]|nr:hypothetical protein [Pseudomonadota bacterium]
MEKLTGRDYMLSAIKRRQADRIPTTVLVGPYCSKMTRYTVREILTDARKSAEAHMAFFDRFQPDSLVVYNDIYLEYEAIGGEMEFPEDDISHPKRPLLEERSQLAKLKVPNPKSDGRIPYFMELCDRVSGALGKAGTMGLGHSGPWNIALHMRGTERLLMDDLMEPEFVHELMRYTTEVVKRVGDTVIEAGFAPSIGEAAASCSIISPKIYREFIKPYHTEICEYFRSKRASMSLHICGFIDPIMDDIVETGIGFLSLDAPSSLEKMVETAGDKMTIMGNVPTSLYAMGTPAEMEKAVTGCIETAAQDSGYILASGCELPLNSTEDRIEHYFRFAREYGRDFISRLKERKSKLFD